MKSIPRAVSLTILSAAFSAAAFAAKCSDVDIPLIVTISSTYQDPSTLINYNAGIRPDSGGDYVDGQNGVTALIHVCNGSNGATLNPGANGRTITYDFRNVVDTNSSTPSWTSAPVIGGSFNFANLLYNYNANATYSFTTFLKWIDMDPAIPGYFFGMENPSAVAPTGTPDAGANTPCVTSLVNVTHIPATSTTKETWIVWPDSGTPASCPAGSPVQVGTLFFNGKHGFANVGQFSVPFYVTIRRK